MAAARRKWGWLATVAAVALTISSVAVVAGADANATFTVGVLAKRGVPQAFTQWDDTFSRYLNAALPGYNFSMTALAFDEVYAAVAQRNVDFVFANPSYYACLERQYGATALATLVNKRSGFSLSEFSGVLFAKADRTDMTTLQDLADAVIEVVDYSSLGGFQMQWGVMDEAGLNPFIFPPELRFANTHDNVVLDVLAGDIDVGAVRTDTLERMESEGTINLTDFRIVNLQNQTDSFPFVRSTGLFPEWPVAMLPHVPQEVAQAVSKALYDMPTDDNATISGKYAGWITPRSYLPLHKLFDEIGFLLPDGSCRRTDSLYDGLFCPDGYQRLPNIECNSTCPASYVCTCRACRKEVKASLDVSDSVVVLGAVERYTVTVSLPGEPLRDVTVTLSLQATGNTNTTQHVTLSSTSLVFTPADWSTAHSFTLELVPHAVEFGNLDAAVFFAVSSEDPDYHVISVQPVQVVLQWPPCTSNDLVYSIAKCDTGSLSRRITSAWEVPLNGSNGAHSATCTGGVGLQAPFTVPCENVTSDSPLAIVINAVVGMFTLLILSAMVFIWRRRKVRRGYIQRSQPAFLLVMCVGAMCAAAFIVTMCLRNTDLTCRLRPLLLSTGFALTFASLVVKSYRVHRIVNNPDMTKRVRLTTSKMMRRLVVLIAVHTVLCLAWVLVDPPTGRIRFELQQGVEVPEESCTEGSIVLVAAIVLFDALLAVAGLVLAYKVRHAGEGFEESRYTGAAVLSIVTVAVMVAPVYAMANLDAVTSYLVICVAVVLTSVGTVALILVPKFFLEWALIRRAKLLSSRNPLSRQQSAPAASGGASSSAKARDGSGGSTGRGARVQLTSRSRASSSVRSDMSDDDDLLSLRVAVTRLEQQLANAVADKKRLLAQVSKLRRVSVAMSAPAPPTLPAT